MIQARSMARGRAASALALLAALAASGCATKKDIRMLRDEVIALQARHDSTRMVMERQYRALFDTLRTAQMAQLDRAGETSHRFRQLEESLDRTQQMLTDLQVLVADLRAQLDQQLVAQRPAPGMGAGQQTLQAGSSDAQQMLNTGIQYYQDGSMAAARHAFEQLIAAHPNDPATPEAQFFLAMTYERENDHDTALKELQKVWGTWPYAPRAPAAMLQAGIIAQESLGNNDLARELYRDVQRQYPGTPEADEAARRAGGV